MTDKEQNHILVVDDDTRLRRLLRRYLTENGFLISEASNPDEARRLMAAFSFDLLVLDVMMPGENGFLFAKSLREKNNMVPILMLTAMGEIQDRIQGLESGVDDYLAKPFDPKELILRINSILRRTFMGAPKEKQDILQFGSTIYHIDRGTLEQNGTFITLTSVENELLKILASKPGHEITREELASLMETENERTIDVQINRLRKKIEIDSKNPRFLQTVRGKGYLLLPD